MNHLAAKPLLKTKQLPAVQGLALGDELAAAIARLRALSDDWRNTPDSRREAAFLKELPIAEIQKAVSALWDNLDAAPDPRATTALLSICIDAIPAAVNLNVDVFLPVALAMIEREPVETLDPIVGGKCRSIELRGFSAAIVALAVQAMLQNQKFAPAISELLDALRGSRSQVWRAAIDGERMIAERNRIIELERRHAEFERKMAIGEIEPLPPPPAASVERERRIAAADAEAKRWRKILDGELDPLAYLCEETEISSLETPIDDDDDLETRAMEHVR